MTRYGKEILACLYRTGGHLTAEQIFLQVKQAEPGIALATVYNNLNRLCQTGEIRRISIHGQTDRYDKTVTPHGHLICERCGKISDVVIQNLLGQLEQQLHTHLNSYELNLHYICPECRAAEEERKCSE